MLAKSKFWYFMKKVCKAKKTGGEMLAMNEILRNAEQNHEENMAAHAKQLARIGKMQAQLNRMEKKMDFPTQMQMEMI